MWFKGYERVRPGKVGTAVIAAHVATGTVSYTHLRAHETVLDLVCRLLLEKKKKRQNIQTISDV